MVQITNSKSIMVSSIDRGCSLTISWHNSTKLSFLLLMAWWLEVALIINYVNQGRAVQVLGWVTCWESLALAWKIRGFKPILQSTLCTVSRSVYNTCSIIYAHSVPVNMSQIQNWNWNRNSGSNICSGWTRRFWSYTNNKDDIFN